jgi:hypothetical protein
VKFIESAPDRLVEDVLAVLDACVK